MPLNIRSNRKSHALAGELNIYTARDAFENLLPKLRAAKSPAVDLRQISEFDCSGLQILLMARREAVDAGKELRIVDASATVREALDLIQCDELRSRIEGAK